MASSMAKPPSHWLCGHLALTAISCHVCLALTCVFQLATNTLGKWLQVGRVTLVTKNTSHRHDIHGFRFIPSLCGGVDLCGPPTRQTPQVTAGSFEDCTSWGVHGRSAEPKELVLRASANNILGWQQADAINSSRPFRQIREGQTSRNDGLLLTGDLSVPASTMSRNPRALLQLHGPD